MNKRLAQAVGWVLLLSSALGVAQDVDMQSLQRNVGIFSGVLEDALEIRQSTGLFGISTGGIESNYLLGQGVVMEVRTPLANRRNRIGIASLNASMQSLQARPSPFDSPSGAALATVPQAELGASNSSQAEASSFYSDMMDTVANIDYTLVMNSAVQSASEAARSLRSMNSLSDEDYREINQEIDVIRNEAQANSDELRTLESQIREIPQPASTSVNNAEHSSMQLALDEFLADIEPLKQAAIAKATELVAQSEAAQREYVARWVAEVDAFEAKLYAAMCDYGGTLRELPEQESISIILTGLGAGDEGARRSDKIHIFKKSDLSECQSGQIDLLALRERGIEYSY